MSETLRRVQTLVLAGEYLISDHGYDELAKDGILDGEVLAGIATAIVIEDYPDRLRGPSVLVLQQDADSRPVHVLWGIPAGRRSPVVLVTAYRPDPELWDDDFKRRRVP
jgi:hypothetical protein